jgi:hypothetical protein
MTGGPADFGNLAPGVNVLSVMSIDSLVQEVHVLGRDLVDTVRELIHEGNVRRIVVKDEHGNTFVEIPVTVAAVGAIVSPILAAIGAISALVAKFTIVVIRSEPKPPASGPSAP